MQLLRAHILWRTKHKTVHQLKIACIYRLYVCLAYIQSLLRKRRFVAQPNKTEKISIQFFFDYFFLLFFFVVITVVIVSERRRRGRCFRCFFFALPFESCRKSYDTIILIWHAQVKMFLDCMFCTTFQLSQTAWLLCDVFRLSCFFFVFAISFNCNFRLLKFWIFHGLLTTH